MPRVRDGLARGDDGELREAVHEIGAAVVEVGRMACSRAPRRRCGSARWSNRPTAMGPMPQQPSTRDCQNSPVLRPRAQMTPMPVTATRRTLLARRRVGLGGHQSSARPSTICRMVRMVLASSSGMVMLNSFSRAKRISTPSMESMPSSSKELSMVTFSRGRRLTVAITFRTRWCQIFGHSSWVTVTSLKPRARISGNQAAHRLAGSRPTGGSGSSRRPSCRQIMAPLPSRPATRRTIASAVNFQS